MCPVCDARLERTSGRSIDAALACSAATLLLLFPANLLPLLEVSLLGATRESHLASGVVHMWRQGWVIPAALVGVLAILLPFVRFGLLTGALGAVRLGRAARWRGPAFRWAIRLDPWAMPDVFLVGCFVGYSRVAASLPTHVGAGGWCFVGAALLSMVSRAALDRRAVWRAIAPDLAEAPSGPLISCTVCDLVTSLDREGRRCERCGARLKARRPDAMVRTAALCIAGFLFYWPANLFPMSRVDRAGEHIPHTIADGIQELLKAGFWPLAILIFCTSILVPVAKIFGLGWFVMSTHRRSTSRLVLKTRLYRLIDELGRWSNVDVFTIAVFTPLMQFDGLVSSRPGAGAVAFILVVVLTMIASQTFDPRLMWDVREAGS